MTNEKTNITLYRRTPENTSVNYFSVHTVDETHRAPDECDPCDGPFICFEGVKGMTKQGEEWTLEDEGEFFTSQEILEAVQYMLGIGYRFLKDSDEPPHLSCVQVD